MSSVEGAVSGGGDGSVAAGGSLPGESPALLYSDARVVEAGSTAFSLPGNA